MRIAISYCFIWQFFRDCYSMVLTSLFLLSVVARKSCMTGPIRIFEKSNFNPKLSALVSFKVKLPNMTDWHILPGLKIGCPHCVLSSASESQKTECCSRYSASGYLQKFAADLSLSTSQNSQPCKIFTLSLNSNQNLHTPAPLNSRFSSQLFKISFVPFNQEIVMQHFDLYSK